MTPLDDVLALAETGILVCIAFLCGIAMRWMMRRMM